MFGPEPYDRRVALKRGAGVFLFFLALALLGPGLLGLAWDTDTPGTIEKWLFVASAALYLTAALAIIAWPVETQRPVTGSFQFFWTRTPPKRIRRRFAYAIAFSLFLHGLILSLRFGIPGLGLPGLALPWGERRMQPTDLTVRLAETPNESAPAAASAPVPLAVAPRVELSVPQRKAPERKTRAQPRPQILAQDEPQPETFSVPPPKPAAEAAPPRAPQVAEKMPEEPQPAVQAAEQAGRQAEEAARKGAEEEARRERESARQRALALQKELEAKKIEEARKQEEETIRDEAKKQEEARGIALAAEALKRAEEAARQQAVRQKELEAKRQAEEAAARAKEAADRQRAEADAAAQRERERAAAATAPGPSSGSELAAKALEQIRRSPLRADSSLHPTTPENPRRRSIFGTERDVPLRMYVESWRSKIERNGSLNYRPSASQRAAQNPIATVSIRSDGSLESVSLNQSSGVRELDQAVLNIARLYAPYSKFPPALAAQFDVLEIRREWAFESTLRLMDVKN